MAKTALEALHDLRDHIQMTIHLGETDQDDDGFISAYHFKTGAIHRLLFQAQRDDSEIDKRPICPSCNRRLVYVALAGGGKLFHTWQCDCEYRKEQDAIIPPEIVGDIMRAREWNDGSLSYDIEVLF